MKKQLLIAAVAATMGTAAMADISITGDAKFEYFNTETATTSTNKTGTEANLAIVGKQGDTSVTIKLELNTHDEGTTNETSEIDIEDMFMTTKIADVNIKAGNWASGTTALLGEIDNGPRASNKVDLSTTISGVKIYAGNSGADTISGTATAQINENMYYGVVGNVAGWTVQAKHVSATEDAFGIAGEVNGLGVRLEHKSNDTANSDVTFGNLTYSVNGIDLGYAFLDVDNTNSLVAENDSSIFAVENGIAAASSRDNQQITAKGSIAGNTVTVKAGSVEKGIDSSTDLDYMQVSAKRGLASGATATVTYTDKDDGVATDTQILELDLSVKF
jgi:hypothetical protein